jgi:hypothetical protein
MDDGTIDGLIKIIEHLAESYGSEYHDVRSPREEVEWALETYPEMLALYCRVADAIDA